MSSAHLHDWEIYAYTTGANHIFVQAAQAVVGGVPTALFTTDPEQLEDHDAPGPLELHCFLQLPDGSCVDAEGTRCPQDLATAFGCAPWALFDEQEEDLGDFGGDLNDDDDAEDPAPARTIAYFETQGVAKQCSKADPALVHALTQRLRDLGWDKKVPTAGEWTNPRHKKAGKACEEHWPAWKKAALEQGEALGLTPSKTAGRRRKLA